MSLLSEADWQGLKRVPMHHSNIWMAPCCQVKLNLKKGEFSPRPHSCWFCWRVCSARDPCTQRSLGSHSEALRSQLDNKAFVQTCRNSKLSTKNKKCQALTFHRGQGRKICNLLTPEKNILLMHNPCKLNFLNWKGKIIKRDVMPVLWINVCMLFLFYNC